MIHDALSEQRIYRSLHARLAQAFDFLLTQDLHILPTGKVTIDGDLLFAMVNEYTTSLPEMCRFESHQRYTDVQYMVTGRERIGITHVAALEIAEPYLAEKDIAFYRPHTDDFLSLTAGRFAVFFPHDAHQPGVAWNEPAPVRKIVLKLALAE
jgi:biofilm protein TabA